MDLNTKTNININREMKDLVKSKGYDLQDLLLISMEAVLDIYGDNDLIIQQKIDSNNKQITNLQEQKNQHICDMSDIEKQIGYLNIKNEILDSELHSKDKKYEIKFEGKEYNRIKNYYQDYQAWNEEEIQQLSNEKGISTEDIKNQILKDL